MIGGSTVICLAIRQKIGLTYQPVSHKSVRISLFMAMDIFQVRPRRSSGWPFTTHLWLNHQVVLITLHGDLVGKIPVMLDQAKIREISKLSFSGLNCHFKGKSQNEMTTRVNSRIFTNSPYVYNFTICQKWPINGYFRTKC